MPGLGLLMLGTGMLKPNVSTIVGQLYAQGDRRRDSGFSIFYMGINLGGLLAPLACGWVGERIGWRLGFGHGRLGDVGRADPIHAGWQVSRSCGTSSCAARRVRKREGV